MLSTKNLESLGKIEQIKNLTQSLALLDAIISPEWEDRQFSFNSRWGENEMMASMRNGSGDEWYLIFNSYGAIMKGLDHESAMYEFDSPIPEIYNDVPAEFRSFLKEESFDISNVSFCIWRKLSDKKWFKGNNINYAKGKDPDGSEYLLSIFDGNPSTYKEHADDYFESDFKIQLIKSIYDHEPLTDKIITGLNPGINLKDLE